MAFVRTWNASYESIPGDTDPAKEGALRIRHLKIDIRERLDVDHSWAGDEHDGKHNKVTLPEHTGDPTFIAETGILYTKDTDDNDVELFYVDGVGNVTQLTDVGGFAIIKTKNNWEKAQYTAPKVLTDGATVTPDLDDSNIFTWTIGGNRTLANPSNRAAGQTFTIIITQDGTGGRTITYGSLYKFPAGFDDQPADGAGDVSVLSCVYDGTNILCSMLQDMS